MKTDQQEIARSCSLLFTPHGRRSASTMQIYHAVDNLRDVFRLAATDDSHNELADMFVDGVTILSAEIASGQAYKNRTLVGYAAYFVSLENNRINLTDIVVSPQQRGRGIGGMLMSSLLTGAKDAGITDVSLMVAEDNKVARALYTRYGFTVSAVVPDYYGRSDDALMLRVDPQQTSRIVFEHTKFSTSTRRGKTVVV